MPTGYTAKIADGISFEDFVMDCARAMGALVDMRDAPAGTPIPEKFEVSNYHSKKAFEAHCALQNLYGVSINDAEKAADDEYWNSVKEKSDGLARASALRDKYEQMLARVRAWKPPSADHADFKQFMIEQIQTSIKFDCDSSYYKNLVPKKRTGAEWLAQEKARLCKAITYHENEYLAEVKRVEARNQWLRQLRDSLVTDAKP